MEYDLYWDISKWSAFDRWCYTSTDEKVKIDDQPAPLLTTLIYRVCDKDTSRFNEALRILELAFEAGRASR